MSKIRILVVDDSVVIRRMLSDALAGDPSLEVAGTAADGKIALAKISQVNPDVVTLDVEMPVMNGLEALAEIREKYPRLPVIMFSTLTERGAAATLDALAMGANDYVTKPANVGGAHAALARIRDELIPKIKTHCGERASMVVAPRPIAMQPGAKTAPPAAARPRDRAAERIDVVAIGVSTGGPNALAEVVPQIPASFPVPVVIVQHMPPIFTRYLADRLALKSQVPVEEAKPGQPLSPGGVLIAPGDYHMIVERHAGRCYISTHQGPPENSCRPAVDVLFRSVAAAYGAHTLAIVMTGMGQDGLRGCQNVYDAGGQILAQDEATSVVWGMPAFVANAGLADRVLPLNQIASEIVRRVNERRAVSAGLARHSWAPMR